MKNDLKRIFVLLGDVSTIGIAMAASVFVGLGMGYLIDNKVFGGRTSPWFTIIFLILGIVAGFRNLVRLAKRKDL
ncbi:MAG: AtpZ/AtpI family protein [Deltaproteobacteria bacterium]|nr:AtpZ/AtpI family protein [Deltaproteobacteria bacterium]MDP2993217.1 AtpZ/AtpI family protein [Deltaproteobacteria bacterium]MDP3029176.1 AtpZ/AtpI family protein [Deltaproteobacteria bacterium]